MPNDDTTEAREADIEPTSTVLHYVERAQGEYQLGRNLGGHPYLLIELGSGEGHPDDDVKDTDVVVNFETGGGAFEGDEDVVEFLEDMTELFTEFADVRAQERGEELARRVTYFVRVGATGTHEFSGIGDYIGPFLDQEAAQEYVDKVREIFNAQPAERFIYGQPVAEVRSLHPVNVTPEYVTKNWFADDEALAEHKADEARRQALMNGLSEA